MDASISPKPKRTVTFEVDENEARNIAGYLNDVLGKNINTPFHEESVRQIMYTFANVRDGK